MNVAIIGTGYVGLTTGVALAYLGHRVVGVDKDSEKVCALKQGKSPIHEPGVSELLAEVGSAITFSEDTAAAVAEADLIMIAVGTPQKPNGEANTRFVEEAVQQVALGLVDGRKYTLVIKSTVPIGTNQRVARVLSSFLVERAVRTNVTLASNPEFLREGMALHDTFYPDRIVVGAEAPEAIDTLRRLYRPLLEQSFEPPVFLPRPEGYRFPTLVTTDPISAEMTKYAANAFLALKISFINEVAGLCEKVGADVSEVARAMGLDPRIGPHFLAAGVGWGGSCFPKDTAALLAVGAEYGYPMPIVEAARQVNSRQRLMIVEKLQVALKVLRGRTIGVLGLAFKPNTDDVREAPSLDIIRLLCERGARVKAHDPVAIPRARAALQDLDVEFADSPYQVSEEADALILVTEWDEYRGLDFAQLARRMHTPVLIDGRNIIPPEEARRAGFHYMGVGR